MLAFHQPVGIRDALTSSKIQDKVLRTEGSGQWKK
jgi:hypothetical protein